MVGSYHIRSDPANMRPCIRLWTYHQIIPGLERPLVIIWCSPSLHIWSDIGWETMRLAGLWAHCLATCMELMLGFSAEAHQESANGSVTIEPHQSIPLPENKKKTNIFPLENQGFWIYRMSFSFKSNVVFKFVFFSCEWDMKYSNVYTDFRVIPA